MTQYTARAFRPSTVSPGDGSRTITITPTPAYEGRDDDIIDPEDRGSRSMNPEDRRGEDGGGTVGALKLRAGKKGGARVAWGEDVIDNEGCGKKKSKICCIYHKPKRFDESSDESDSDADSDSSCNHDHGHANGGEGAASRPNGGSSTIHRMDDGYSAEPNAYERMPNWKGKGKGKHKANGNA